MRTSKTVVIVAAAALLGMGGLNIANAAETEGLAPGRAGRGQLLERIKERLDLTDDQVGQIKAQLSVEKDTLKGLILKLHEARVAVREAIREGNASEASVRSAAAKVGAVQSDLAVERFKLYTRINPILTDEQRQKVKQFETQIDDWVEAAVNRLGERWQTR